MADKEASHSTWIVFTVLIASMLLLIAKPALSKMATETFAKTDKINLTQESFSDITEQVKVYVTIDGAKKVDIKTNTDSPIAKGTIFYVNKKITYNGTQYFQAVSDNNSYIVISSKSISSSVIYENFLNPRYMKITKDTNSVDPLTGKIYASYKAGDVIFFNTKVYVDGRSYYRTKVDTTNNLNAAIDYQYITDIN